MVLEEEILRQPTVYCSVWLLIVTLMHIYYEKEQAEQEKKSKKLEEKNTKKYIGAKSRAQGHKQIKGKPDVKWNKGSEYLKTRLKRGKIPTHEKEFKKILRNERNH